MSSWAICNIECPKPTSASSWMPVDKAPLFSTALRCAHASRHEQSLGICNTSTHNWAYVCTSDPVNVHFGSLLKAHGQENLALGFVSECPWARRSLLRTWLHFWFDVGVSLGKSKMHFDTRRFRYLGSLWNVPGPKQNACRTL